MNDRMSDMDALELSDNEALIQRLAHLSPFYAQDSQLAVDYVRAIFRAVGLPALLERVEAAEAEVARLRIGLDGAHGNADRMRKSLLAERDALAAKVARVEAVVAEWDHVVGTTNPAWRLVEPLRAILNEGESP